MSEYIKKEAVLRAYEEVQRRNGPWRFEKLIESVPTEDVALVRHGRWEGYSHPRYCGIDDFGDPIYKDGVVYYCSECRRRTVIKEIYCPNCGAKMDG